MQKSLRLEQEERRGRKGYAEVAEEYREMFSLRPLRSLCDLCVLFLMLACATQAQAASGKVFVSSEKDNAMAIIDAATSAVVGSAPLCKRPRHMQLAPGGQRLLVACSDDHRVLVWDI